MADIGGINIQSLFNKASESLNRDGTSLQQKIDSLNSKDSIDQKDLLQIQFQMGQYNAKLEAMSSMIKSIQDMLKALAQRTG
ncbi:MAG: type III secretion protein [Desulfovibrionaceae bacterium]|nr:type III secretion protein [Desulfovibrionaceae bacterium]